MRWTMISNYVVVIVAKLDGLKSHSRPLVYLEQLYSAFANQKRNIQQLIWTSYGASLIGGNCNVSCQIRRE